ncbi:AEC family transporter [Clostridium sp. SYSU_GA19001]|uniref:AEC family transporter n=1 Tax=Clostridium caldaquaticum TaxID=2940653 RepID=UPI002076E720|nr:AEC family transporter [Clostridium caldaquaticum]MCM8712114.1 AEC family transporter [Clostridium caldaquaticum]
MAIKELIDLQLTMFLMVITGLILKKLNVISQSGKESLTNLVIYVLLPCNIIKSFMITFDKNILMNFGVMLVISIFIQFMCSFLGKILYVKCEPEQRKVLQYGTVCSNAGFLGNPIAESVFGMMGLLYASIFLIPQRIVMWSAGVATFTESPDSKTLIKRVLTHPCIVAVFIGLLFMFAKVHLPVFLDNPLKSFSTSSTALSMVVIGTILADVDFKTLFNKTVLYYTVLRLFVLPLIVWIVCMIFKINSLVTGVAVILTAMPAGTTTGILAAKYDGDYLFASQCIIFSTLVSVVSIPIWSFLLK